MTIRELKFKNFRNLKPGKMQPSETINVIHGENAQGKTNLIEAMWLFTGGRSFRATKDADLTMFGENRTELEMELKTQGRNQDIKISIEKGARKVEVNMVQKRSSEMIGKFCAVVFSPTHLSLIKDGPSQRRRFLDTAICQLWPIYAKNLIKYNKTINQRNALLKSCKQSSRFSNTIEIWDESLAVCAAEITKKRLEYIKLLQDYAVSAYHGISSGKEELSLQYKSSLPKGEVENANEAALSELYLQVFQKSKNEDFALGFTTKGPHRDDFDIKVNGKHARMFSSQGQQRSVVLAMKLAEAKIIEKERYESPVILLDDVMSELDSKRQNYILNALGNLQVFITCCNPEILNQMAGGKTFLIEKGEIT